MSFGVQPGSGWVREDRNIRPFVDVAGEETTKVVLPIYTRGFHAAECELSDYGWLCSQRCVIEDMDAIPSIQTTVDSLIEVLELVERDGLRVEWSLGRVSHRYNYINGRCQLPGGELINQETWSTGRTWTKWGARRKLRRAVATSQAAPGWVEAP